MMQDHVDARQLAPIPLSNDRCYAVMSDFLVLARGEPGIPHPRGDGGHGKISLPVTLTSLWRNSLRPALGPDHRLCHIFANWTT